MIREQERVDALVDPPHDVRLLLVPHALEVAA